MAFSRQDNFHVNAPLFAPSPERKRIQRRQQRSLSVVERQSRFQAQTFINSVGFALEGLSYAFQTQRNLRIDLMAAVAVLALGCLLQVSLLEWVALTLSVFLVLVAELINTAIEILVDMWTGDRYNLRAKRVKDLSAAACLLTACCAACIGAFVFVPHLLQQVV